MGLTGAKGNPGPAAVKFHIDVTNHPFTNTTLAHIGAWTIQASCSSSGGTTTLALRAIGPADSVMDGLEVGSGGYPVSYIGSNMKIGNDLSFPTSGGGGTNIDELTLFSPTGGEAHISVFKYAASTPSTVRCKISGTGYAAP